MAETTQMVVAAICVASVVKRFDESDLKSMSKSVNIDLPCGSPCGSTLKTR